MKEHTRKEIRGFKPDIRRLLKYGSELDLMRYLREIGIRDEDPRFAAAVKAFRDVKSGKL